MCIKISLMTILLWMNLSYFYLLLHVFGFLSDLFANVPYFFLLIDIEIPFLFALAHGLWVLLSVLSSSFWLTMDRYLSAFSFSCQSLLHLPNNLQGGSFPSHQCWKSSHVSFMFSKGLMIRDFCVIRSCLPYTVWPFVQNST